MTSTAPTTLLHPDDASVVVLDATELEHPHRKTLATAALGYVVITATLFAIGMLLTHPLASSVGVWDQHVNEYFAGHRTAFGNDVTSAATAAFNTMPVVIAASLVVGFLAVRRHFREAAFLTLALLIEITCFLSVTFVVARPRPDVVRLNSTPATSSFPSGHTAAATVLFVGIAIIVICRTDKLIARVSVVLLATVVAAAVAYSRVYRGLHYPTDVFVGVLFGLACLIAAGMAVRAQADAPSSEEAAEGARRDLGDPLER